MKKAEEKSVLNINYKIILYPKIHLNVFTCALFYLKYKVNATAIKMFLVNLV